jgi:DNA repair protein RadD
VKRDPRPHQVRALEMLRESVRPVAKGGRGKRRPLLKFPTGGGKTYVAAVVFANMKQKNPNARLLFIVDAISLIDQTVTAFYEEGLYDIGVIQADHIMTDWSKSLQVASVQTLRRRGMPKADLIIVDEAHCMDSWLLSVLASDEWAQVPVIGLSATPWSKGLGHHYDDLIEPVSMQALINQGYLCPFRVYASAHPDLSGVKTVAGDYHEGQLSEVMRDDVLTADVVQNWLRNGQGRPTFLFGVDCAHAKKLEARFLAAGVPWAYIDAYTEKDDRRRILGQLDAGEIKGVASVGCLTKGVDLPSVSCIILARPTKSEMLFVQMLGRGLRTAEGKEDCLIFDHSDTTLRLGFPTDINHPELCTAKKGEKKKQERSAPLPKECPSCSVLKPAKVHVCPSCGFKPEKRSEIEEADGELVEVTGKKRTATKSEKQLFYSMLLSIARARGRSDGWVSHAYQEKFGVWPRDLSRVETPANEEVRNFVRYKDIRFAKRRSAA